MDKQRRNFLHICAMATATAAWGATPAWANRIRVLGDVSEQDRLIAIGHPGPSFHQFINGIRLGQARRHGALTVFWLASLSYSVFQGLYYGVRTALFMDVTTKAVAATQFTAYMAMLNLVISYSAGER